MYEKNIICISILVFLLIVAGVGTWYITKSEAFYPSHFKIGKFIAVNNTAKCYIYDAETDTFTGDYFTVNLKTKGIADKGGMKIGENGHGSLVINDEKISYDEMFVMFEINNEYGEIIFAANNVKITNNGTDTGIDKTGVDYTFYYSGDFTELHSVQIHQDGKTPVIGYVGESLEEAEKIKTNLQ